jgi:hypothetical protein
VRQANAEFVSQYSDAPASHSGDSQTERTIRNKPKPSNERPLHARPDMRTRFSSMPWSVLLDENLKDFDTRVYGCLSARAFQGDTVAGSAFIEASGVRPDEGRSPGVRLEPPRIER